MTGVALWQAAEIIEATDGKAERLDWQVTNVAIDTRKLTPGGLFVALPGTRSDGHAHLRAAAEAGAVAALVTHRPADTPDSLALILVPDAEIALQQIGIAGRKRFTGRLIGVTGSVGKTSTKELLKCALSTYGSVYVSVGNYNNHLGVPLSLANVPPGTDVAVQEMGMNHAGEIAVLTRWARPDIAIITGIEAVHLEYFDSVADIARAKAEILEGLDPDSGIAILPADSPYFPLLRESAQALGIRRVECFSGKESAADACLLAYEPHTDGAYIMLRIKENTHQLDWPVNGRHMAQNLLAVMLAIRALGHPLEPALSALQSFHSVEGRGSTLTLTLDAERIVTLIDDSYNASPASVRAALASLAERSVIAGAGRIVVLGDMLELGPDAAHHHRALVEDICHAGVSAVYLYGPFSAGLAEVLSGRVPVWHEREHGIIARRLFDTLRTGDIVLVKGSRGSRMDRVISELKAQISGETLTHAV